MDDGREGLACGGAQLARLQVAHLPHVDPRRPRGDDALVLHEQLGELVSVLA